MAYSISVETKTGKAGKKLGESWEKAGKKLGGRWEEDEEKDESSYHLKSNPFLKSLRYDIRSSLTCSTVTNCPAHS